MEDARKEITFSGMRPSRTFTKLIERHVEKWIERERTLLFLSKQTSYCVHVDKESRHYFTCHIEIRIGAREWSGLDEGRSLIEAVLNALKHLKPKERIELYRPPVLPTPQPVEQITA